MRAGSGALALALAGAGCVGHARAGAVVTLRAACGEHERWDGRACVAAASSASSEIVANEARIEADPEAALATVEADAQHGPFDRPTYARVWRERGMAHALLAAAAAAAAKDDPSTAAEQEKAKAAHEQAARDAFDMLLAIDPTHRLEYTLSPQTTFVFQDAIAQAAKRATPAVDVDWKRDARVGDDLPVDVEVVADPKSFLARAILFVRRRGDAGWQSADLALAPAGDYRRVVLPSSLAAGAKKAIALELYLRAFDPQGNEVLDWASPSQPREVPLRWEPPAPWYRKWWVWAIAGGAVAGATGVIVYAAEWQPSSTVGGTVSR